MVAQFETDDRAIRDLPSNAAPDARTQRQPKLQVEGFTDSIGSDEYNQRLSEERAEAVCDYLVSNGVNMNNVAAEGMGKSDPIASNSTAQGRKLNRRVEMVVSGDVIGSQITPGAVDNGQNNEQNPPPITPQQ